MKTFLIAAAALAAATPALAQPPQGAGQGPGQGAGGPAAELTRVRAEEMVKGQLDRLDANHDGIIVNAEIEKVIDMISTAGGPPQIADRLHGLMKEFGKDGRIVVADLVKARLAQFDAADVNHDGKLDAKERQAAMAAMAGQRPGAPQ